SKVSEGLLEEELGSKAWSRTRLTYSFMNSASRYRNIAYFDRDQKSNEKFMAHTGFRGGP
ncbi:MAG: hypothetical protein NT172_03050, partial [Planctomycetota bacterium]|nr:hypothetical protein [Planctomycetota bacterium]